MLILIKRYLSVAIGSVGISARQNLELRRILRVISLSTIICSLIMVLTLLAPIGATAATSQTPDNSGSNSQLLRPEQLAELVVPIALYPDSLLAEVLMASAYPTDIVHAERWRESHKNLKGDQLTPSTNKIGTTASNHWWRRRRGVYRFACEAI